MYKFGKDRKQNGGVIRGYTSAEAKLRKVISRKRLKLGEPNFIFKVRDTRANISPNFVTIR